MEFVYFRNKNTRFIFIFINSKKLKRPAGSIGTDFYTVKLLVREPDYIYITKNFFISPSMFHVRLLIRVRVMLYVQ